MVASLLRRVAPKYHVNWPFFCAPLFQVRKSSGEWDFFQPAENVATCVSGGRGLRGEAMPVAGGEAFGLLGTCGIAAFERRLTIGGNFTSSLNQHKPWPTMSRSGDGQMSELPTRGKGCAHKG